MGDIDMTHEYIIAVRGRVHTWTGRDPDREPATAIAWAADHVLAVGPDAVVRSISRGDSIFLDLDGCVVVAAQDGVALEPGSAADLDIWDSDPFGPDAGMASQDPPRIVARVRAGAFTDGDDHCGPLRRL